MTMVQIADSLVGLGPGDPRYRELCYPHDEPKVAEQMAKGQSACALVCGGALRCFGVEHVELATPYAWRFAATPSRRPVDAMVRLQVMGGWHADTTRLPEPGEIAIMGSGLGTHAFICRDRSDTHLESVDGGKGKVRVAKRAIVRGPSSVGLRDGMGIRWIVGVLRCGELVPTLEWVLPGS